MASPVHHTCRVGCLAPPFPQNLLLQVLRLPTLVSYAVIQKKVQILHWQELHLSNGRIELGRLRHLILNPPRRAHGFLVAWLQLPHSSSAML